MRLSRPRIVLRALLLLLGGAVMLWRAQGARSDARAALASGAENAQLLSRVALVELLVGLLALGAAVLALLALRRRRPRHTLRLSDLGTGASSPGEPAGRDGSTGSP